MGLIGHSTLSRQRPVSKDGYHRWLAHLREETPLQVLHCLHLYVYVLGVGVLRYFCLCHQYHLRPALILEVHGFGYLAKCCRLFRSHEQSVLRGRSPRRFLPWMACGCIRSKDVYIRRLLDDSSGTSTYRRICAPSDVHRVPVLCRLGVIDTHSHPIVLAANIQSRSFQVVCSVPL